MNAPLDAVAIVGMAGRFPGAASIDEFWRNLICAQESITRFRGEQLSPLVPAEVRGHPRYVAARGVIADADRFDAAFFGIAPAEAVLMDPQQRVFLELCWNALEHAGLDTRRYPGSIGVYAGVSNNGYRRLLDAQPQALAASGEFAAMLANEKDYVATRVAHRIGLTGPALSIHTACSTSLVAVAQAWYALMSWQCDAALAGGINIVVPQESGHVPVDGGMESADGHCRPFDADASGTLFSSGGGVVVLKRLADAIAERDTIWAVIRGVGVNNDGAEKASFTAPSARGQAEAIALAHATARVPAESIGYVEAHGTATALGDPIEIEALTRAFACHERGQFCRIGSVKSNIGHLVAGAGVAGLIKTALALHHELIPPSLHFRRPNPQIDFAATPFRVADRAAPWPRSAQPRRAGVSSFGVGGTNAHVVLEEAPEAAPRPAPPDRLLVLPLSAHDAAALQRRADDLVAALSAHDDGALADVGWTLALGRRELGVRGAVVASGIAEAQQRLHAVAAHAALAAPRVVFAFPGQGSQHVDMARALIEREPVFADAFAQCCALAAPLLDRDLRALILPAADARDESRAALAQTRYAQPALFAVEYALAQAWRAYGVEPAAMIGHSIGEYVAACVAGVFPLEIAVRLVVARGAVMDAQPRGAMLTVQAPCDDVAARLPEGVEIAAVNAADATVVSGRNEDIDAFARRLQAERIASTTLEVSHAFHCALMDGALAPFRRAFEDVELAVPRMPFYSCVSGAPIAAAAAASPDYWCQQIRAPVRFADAAAHALGDDNAVVLEVGPGQALTNLLRREAGWRERVVASCGPARDAGDAAEHFAAAAAALWCRGIRVDWERWFDGAQRRRVALPGYPFRGPRYWIETPEAASRASAAEKQPKALVDSDAKERSPPARHAELRELFASLCGTTLTADHDRTRLLDLGLDSLALTQAALELERRYGLKLKFRRLLGDLDCIDKLAALLEPAVGDREPQAERAEARNFAATPAMRASSERQSSVARNDAPQPFGAAARITRHADTAMDARQQDWLRTFTDRYARKTAGSKTFSQEQRAPMADPRAVTGFNPLWKELVYPIVVERSEGARLWDVDGNEYIDLLNGFGANFLGYQPDFIRHALVQQVETGFEIGPQHPLTAQVTALIRDLTQVERVAFCNTGSEAVMGAMRLARTVTGRKTIVIFRDSYHGIFDEVVVRGTPELRSIAAAPGILANAVENVLVLDYGSDAALAVIRARAPELAAVMIEPIQARNPGLQPHAFVRELRAICDGAGCALIFDEVITGFRIAPGGAQAFYGVRADIVTYGKIIGGGLPLAVIAGKSQWLDALDGGQWRFGDDSRPEAGVTYFAGTFVRHPLALAAAKAALTHLRERGPDLQRVLNERTAGLAGRLNDFFAAQAAPIAVVHFASLWRLRVDPDQPFAELFFYALRERGLHVYAQFNCFLSVAHGEREVALIVSRIEAATRELLEAGVLQHRSGEAAVRSDSSKASAADALPPGEVAPTDAQTEKWIASQFGESASVAFNESQLLELRGPLDVGALERAIALVTSRHEAFSMSFAADGSALRVGAAAPIVPCRVELGAEHGSESLRAHCATVVRRPFDLTRAPLARIELIRLDAERHALLIVAHHLVFDGWSAAVFFRELAVAYRAFAAGATPELPPPQSFRAFALDEQRRRDSDATRAQLEYWLGCYRDVPDALDLPTDRPRPLQPQFAADTAFHDFSAARTAAVRELARHCGVTLYATLLAAFGVLLAKLSGQSDFAIGIPFARQAVGGRDAMLGDGVNTLPLRVRVRADESFAALARACHEALLDAADHQDLTLYTLLSALDRRQRAERGTLTDLIFNLNPPLPALDFGAARGRVRDCAKAALVKDLFFNLCDDGARLTLDVHYRTALFDAATIARWIGHFDSVLARAAADPQRAVAELPVLLPEQERLLAHDLNATARDFDCAQALPALIAAQAQATPDRIAVEHAGRTLSYGDLFAQARALAGALRERGVERGDIVGICVPRGLELLPALLGVWFAGAAYLPLDLGYPEQRLRGVVDHARVRHLIALADQKIAVGIAQRCTVHAFDALVAAAADAAAPFEVDAEALAYVLFTSGSTGTPKGVRILHRNLANALLSMRERPGLRAEDVLCAVTTLSFDIAGLELYLPLLAGARVLVASEAQQRDPDALIALMRERGATVLQTTPSWLRVLASGGRARNLPRLRLLIGGEELPRDLAETVLPHCAELWNLYGPTETTIWSTVARVASGEGNVPIGTPIANTRVYILDANRRLVPPGVRGEIWIGGAGVADGYLHLPELTAERFLPDPFADGRMYRTGDIGSWSNGQLCFHGRIDDQVKLRGFRIEPGDIEAAALAEPGVAAAVATVFARAADDRRLVLYVVAPGAADDFAHELRNRLRQRLPPHMVPQHIERIDALPQTAHGKIDRSALPAPTLGVGAPRRAVAADDDALTTSLRDIWKELLGVAEVPLDGNFFDLGGDSLLGVELFQRAHVATGVNLPLATLLTAQTVREQARVFRAAGAGEVPAQRPAHVLHSPVVAREDDRWSPLVAIQAGGERPPLFAVHALGGNVLNYVPLARALGPDQPVFGLQAIGLDGLTPPLETVERMAQRYLLEIRSRCAHGPYYLCGGSMGGLIAFEIAQVLAAEGEEVPFLGLFDTYGPGNRSADLAPRGLFAQLGWRWHDRWLRVRGGDPVSRRAMIALALKRRGHRFGDAAREAWHRARGTALPNAVLYRKLERIHLHADDSYSPRPYHGPLTLFRAANQPERLGQSWALGWEAVALGGIRVVDLPGTHDTLIEQPDLARALREALDLAVAGRVAPTLRRTG